ncbi:MAG TPA: peptidoglycan-binding domain-containing protein, partial [Xanthobacteraceae bacterium]
MRIIVGALVLLCATTLASAQDGGAAPSTAAKAQRAAKPGSPRAVYEAMTLAERVAIQSDLVWTGDLNGLPDGEFGERSITAVKAYQKRQGGKETGILNPQERSQLAAAAKARQESVGWRLVGDAATGARLGLPSKLVPRADKARTGSRWQSARAEVQVETWREAGTLAATFDHHKREAGRKVTYSVLRPSLFVIAGLQGLKAFYIRAQSLDEEVRGITILYDQAMEGIMAPIVVAMAGAFQPFPAGADGPRRRVEYASGVVVGAGEIVTDRAATEACQVITIAGVGHAERLAADKASG